MSGLIAEPLGRGREVMAALKNGQDHPGVTSVTSTTRKRVVMAGRTRLRVVLT